jgi:hypothetical protein
MNDSRREQKVFDKTYTANATDNLSDYTVIDLLGAKAPMLLVVETNEGGASAPVTPSVVLEVQQGAQQDGPWADVSGWANTAITSTGNQIAVKENTTQVSRYLRVRATVSFGTANDGTRVQGWIVGDAR